MTRDATQGTRLDWQQGYETYQRGHKVSSGATAAFREGWWTAHDRRERFGEYDSFLVAPDGVQP